MSVKITLNDKTVSLSRNLRGIRDYARKSPVEAVRIASDAVEVELNKLNPIGD